MRITALELPPIDNHHVSGHLNPYCRTQHIVDAAHRTAQPGRATSSQVVERPTYLEVFVSLRLLAEDYAGALAIAAALALMVLLGQDEDSTYSGRQRLHRHIVAVSGGIRNGCPYGQPWKRGNIYQRETWRIGGLPRSSSISGY